MAESEGRRFLAGATPAQLNHFKRWLMDEVRGRLLEDIANLPDDLNQFWIGPRMRGQPMGLWRLLFGRESRATLRRLGKEVNRLWSPRTSQGERTRIIVGWIKALPTLPSADSKERLADADSETLHNIRAQVLAGWLTLRKRLFICAKCARPFFADRETQKFCSQAECRVEANNLYGKRYWQHKSGKKDRTPLPRQQRAAMPARA